MKTLTNHQYTSNRGNGRYNVYGTVPQSVQSFPASWHSLKHNTKKIDPYKVDAHKKSGIIFKIEPIINRRSVSFSVPHVGLQNSMRAYMPTYAPQRPLVTYIMPQGTTRANFIPQRVMRTYLPVPNYRKTGYQSMVSPNVRAERNAHIPMIKRAAYTPKNINYPVKYWDSTVKTVIMSRRPRCVQVNCMVYTVDLPKNGKYIVNPITYGYFLTYCYCQFACKALQLLCKEEPNYFTAYHHPISTASADGYPGMNEQWNQESPFMFYGGPRTPAAQMARTQNYGPVAQARQKTQFNNFMTNANPQISPRNGNNLVVNNGQTFDINGKKYKVIVTPKMSDNKATVPCCGSMSMPMSSPMNLNADNGMGKGFDYIPKLFSKPITFNIPMNALFGKNNGGSSKMTYTYNVNSNCNNGNNCQMDSGEFGRRYVHRNYPSGFDSMAGAIGMRQMT
ncbi:unnamed protein product [Bursaphelenchus xylophilus]|uniref:(pine wood nematode) hypothetical protein n=1 Tax=Bursaphelenchus xylophilus TaxID=6326 RepID=A0A1I7SAV3_BURXY|nr:unnamed protein product [Bursaphelenchus xylophilus]CAG9126738.1 unnamed protein product [Bursaphelenchus xylophilus]